MWVMEGILAGIVQPPHFPRMFSIRHFHPASGESLLRNFGPACSMLSEIVAALEHTELD